MDYKEFVSNGMKIRLTRNFDDSFNWYELRPDDSGNQVYSLVTSIRKQDLPAVLNALKETK